MPTLIISEEDSVFTDADEEPGSLPVWSRGDGSHRPITVPERVMGFQKPSAPSSVSQKRRRKRSHDQHSSAGLDYVALSQINGLIEAGYAVVIGKLERYEEKQESFEKRLGILEHDGFQAASRTETAEKKIAQLELENVSLKEQLAFMYTHSKEHSMVLKFDGFGQRSINKDIEHKNSMRAELKVPLAQAVSKWCAGCPPPPMSCISSQACNSWTEASNLDEVTVANRSQPPCMISSRA